MKTYVEVYVSSDGAKASEIMEIMTNLGFKSSYGEQDFVFNWKKEVVLAEILKFVDKIQSKLKGTGVFLKFTTIK
jgi:hypothetical protein